MNPFSRRMFLRGLGGAALTVPFLPSMSREARAQSAVPVRYVQMISRFGRWFEHWYPADATEVVQPHVARRRLSEYPAAISPILGSHFAPLKNKIALLRGLDGMTAYNLHSMGMPTTASGTIGADNEVAIFGYSIDTVLEESRRFYPTPARVPALRVLPVLPSHFWRWSFSWKTVGSDKVRLPHIEDVNVAFDTVFGDGVQHSPTDDRPQRRKRKIVDAVIEDYRRVRGSARLSASDRGRLENYLTLVSELQGRLQATPSMPQQCGAPSLTPVVDNLALHRNFTDICVAALACDLTRVVSYVFSDHLYPSDADHPPTDLHSTAHNWPERDTNRAYNTWVSQRVAEMMSKMDAIAEPNGMSLLDNSIVYYGNCASKGFHKVGDMPVVVGGSAQGRLRTGEYIDFRQRPFVELPYEYSGGDDVTAGRPYNALLVTFFRALGLQPADWHRLGQTSGFGDYNPSPSGYVDVRPFYDAMLRLDRDAALPYYAIS